MLDNSTAAIAEHEILAARQDPVSAIAVIGLIIGIIGLIQSSLFTYSAVVGLGKPDGWVPPPEEWGKPWPFSIATGLEGPKPNESEPLQGAGGPFPDVHLFNDNGDYLGAAKDRTAYIGHNRAIPLDIYPINVHKHEGQYASFAILAGKGDGRDPLCIVDFGLGLPNYHSGVYRKNANGTVPCFWLGGYGVQGIQVHLPSHTFGQTSIPFAEINKTNETAHDWFCNRPAVLNLWEELPPRHKVPGILVKDLQQRAGRTLEDTRRLHKDKKLLQPGRRSSFPSPHEDTVTIATELPGLSASELCEDALSMGPDYVNIPEGKFCRMSDKTLWPTCGNQRSKVGPTDDCFDVESRQLVVGGKVTRSKPYSKELHFPLK
ncbi:hypothetical protein SLS63_009577 [Diaporthe eres]|uniref:Uncharacterized protein n=1 Tax=Diaporthe eres TaxID=83184 RepID=A0ABR1NZD1_DIAER